MGVPDLMMTLRTEAAVGLRKPFREFLADLGAHAPCPGSSSHTWSPAYRQDPSSPT